MTKYFDIYLVVERLCRLITQFVFFAIAASFTKTEFLAELLYSQTLMIILIEVFSLASQKVFARDHQDYETYVISHFVIRIIGILLFFSILPIDFTQHDYQLFCIVLLLSLDAFEAALFKDNKIRVIVLIKTAALLLGGLLKYFSLFYFPSVALFALNAELAMSSALAGIYYIFHARFKIGKVKFKNPFALVGFVYVSDILTVLYNRLDVLVLNFLGVTNGFSTFTLTIQLLSVVYFVPLSLRSRFISLVSKKGQKFYKLDLTFWIICIAAFACLAIALPTAMFLVYGERYLFPLAYYILIAAAGFAGVLGIFLNFVLLARGIYAALPWRSAIVLIVGLPTSFLLISNLGVLGACINIALMNVISVVIYVVHLVRIGRIQRGGLLL